MKKSEKNENLNKFLKAIVVVLLTILVITVIYNMIFKINKEISNTDFNISDAQKNTVTTNNIEDWNLILVNRWNKMPENYTIDLIEVPGGEKVDKRIYEPLMKMLEDAKKENWGKEPLIVSGYRTNENQKELYDDKIKRYKNKGYSKEKAKEEAEKWVSVPFYIALNTGLRESECMGLRWKDVNFEKKTISVNKQLLYQDRKWCFCPLKTKNSYRTINISDNFVKFLKELKEQQTKNKKLYGEGYKRNFVTERLKRNKENYIEVNDLINVKENGEMLTHNSIKFLSRIIRDDLHIPFKFHNLRHTYATILAESGISPRYVQEMLGHSKLEFTLKYYTHITGHMADMARLAIDKMIQI